MTFGHEKLDVYNVAKQYVRLSDEICKNIPTQNRNIRDQLIRSSESIPLNIAEGNGKATPGDRRRYFEIARGSAVECAASFDVIHIYGIITNEQHEECKQLLDRIAAMLTKLGGRTYFATKSSPK